MITTLIGLGVVMLLVSLTGMTLYFWHTAEEHIPAIQHCAGSDIANRWCLVMPKP